jgi:hypothetical protein
MAWYWCVPERHFLVDCALERAGKNGAITSSRRKGEFSDFGVLCSIRGGRKTVWRLLPLSAEFDGIMAERGSET